MIRDEALQKISGTLCIASVIVYPLFILGIIDFSMVIAFPMHIGIIFTGFVLSWRPHSQSIRWNSTVPKIPRFVLPLIILIGVANIVYGFAGLTRMMSSVEPVHHLNAYFENGKCLAVFNKDKAVEMPSDFCNDFSRYFSTAFCGAWMFLSAVLNWMSWKRRSAKQE